MEPSCPTPPPFGEFPVSTFTHPPPPRSQTCLCYKVLCGVPALSGNWICFDFLFLSLVHFFRIPLFPPCLSITLYTLTSPPLYCLFFLLYYFPFPLLKGVIYICFFSPFSLSSLWFQHGRESIFCVQERRKRESAQLFFFSFLFSLFIFSMEPGGAMVGGWCFAYAFFPFFFFFFLSFFPFFFLFCFFEMFSPCFFFFCVIVTLT